MPEDSSTPKPLNMQVTVYNGDRLLAAAMCALWPDSKPAEGVIAVPRDQNWFSFVHLTLVTADGTEYRILPKRLEHVGGGLPMLLFDIG